jgi:hypothetical protein
MSEMLKLVAKSKIPSAQSSPPTNSHMWEELPERKRKNPKKPQVS